MKVAVVTGASYGLGKSISEMLLKNEFKVYGVSRTEPKIQDANFVWIKANLLNDESFKLICSSISEDKIDLLINNAGVVYAESSLEFRDETFNKTFGLNLIAPVKMVAVLKNKLIGGIVVNISSTSDRFVENGLGMYCASKASLDIYFDAVAIENPDIRILNILPVYIDTPMLIKISGELNFSTDDAISPTKLAESIKDVLFANHNLESGARIIMLSNKCLDEIQDPEKLYYYNVDTKEFKKLK